MMLGHLLKKIMERLKNTEKPKDSFFDRCRGFIQRTLGISPQSINIDHEIVVVEVANFESKPETRSEEPNGVVEVANLELKPEIKEEPKEVKTNKAKKTVEEEKWKRRRARRKEQDRERKLLQENQNEPKNGTPQSNSIKNEDFGMLLNQYSSTSDIQKALREKQAGLEECFEPINIKKNYPRPQDELDLHNCTGEEARKKTKNYLKNSQRNKLRTVRIITGKGIHSENAKAVVRSVVSETMIGLKKEGLALDYEWESKTEQKSGAIIVYLATR